VTPLAVCALALLTADLALPARPLDALKGRELSHASRSCHSPTASKRSALKSRAAGFVARPLSLRNAEEKLGIVKRVLADTHFRLFKPEA
jgi:hypothetical protein